MSSDQDDTDADRILLLSFSKSGSNWVRYCIEHFSGRRTPGSKRQLLVEDGPAIIERQHIVEHWHRRQLLLNQEHEPGEEPEALQRSAFREWLSYLRKRPRTWRLMREKRVIMVLRDPLDLYVRVRATAPQALAGYAGNIRIFDGCKRDTLLIHYEDLMENPREIGRILDFAAIPHDLDSFDFDEHRKRSLELYDRGTDPSVTKGKMDRASRHRERLNEDQRKAILDYLRRELGAGRFERYLGRYAA